MHEALAAALIKDEADRAIFDESFNRFFAAPSADRGAHPDQRGDQVSAAAGRGRPGDHPSILDKLTTRKLEQPRESAVASNRDEKSLPHATKASKKTKDAHGDDARGEDASHDSEDEKSREQRGDADGREESRMPGIDAARVTRICAIRADAIRQVFRPGLRRGARGAGSPDSPLPDSAWGAGCDWRKPVESTSGARFERRYNAAARWSISTFVRGVRAMSIS